MNSTGGYLPETETRYTFPENDVCGVTTHPYGIWNSGKPERSRAMAPAARSRSRSLKTVTAWIP